MATIAANPYVLRDVSLKIAADNYEKAVSAVAFTPTTASVTWQGGTPDASFTMAGATTWVCTITFSQDWDTAGSLSNLLFDSDGQTKAIEFRPIAGGVGFKADVILVPGAMGGAIGSTGEASVTLGVRGKPVRLPKTTV
ncbi:hypothetical protein C5C41_06750 [Rathayibacter sp. AY1E9]|uniref:hypothetical protein n=1 Tax=Rathayibacter sp. AY1E9 TaxID=2080556 RepID=UPI000CE8668F|nr:hypothetical protein [Rathayibacter sp. AY1E9]PPG53418.1 hypothetical protein C5C41_06750 [Rathayibacter sp. AY1E9]